MRCEIDMTTDPRGAHFAYFCSLANPSAGVTVPVDVTALVQQLNGHGFFLPFLWCVMRAVNSVPEFRRRISEGKVWEFDVCPASCTVLKEDGTYAYCRFHADADYDTFYAAGKEALRRTKESGDITESDEDLLPCYFISSVPWLAYTQVVNPWGDGEDSNPRINWGKYEETNGRIMLPVSIFFHHGLADGLHIGRFYEQLQQEMAQLCRYLSK